MSTKTIPPPLPLTSFEEVAQYYRLARLTLPPAHPSLSKKEERYWRLLQTNTFPHSTKLHFIWPAQYDPHCRFCKAPFTLYHMVWECQLNPSLSAVSNPSVEQWEGELASSSVEEQLRLIHRAETAGRSNGVLDFNHQSSSLTYGWSGLPISQTAGH